MRIAMIAACLALFACVSAPGAEDAAAPFTSSAAAQTPAPNAQVSTPLDLPAGIYQLDRRHASVLFRIRHMGLSWFTARFDTLNASLTLDPQDPTRSQLQASVDAGSVNTGVLNASGERSFDAAIGRAIGGETTPQISFTSTSIRRTGQFTGEVTGDLTMNGQTHPVILNVTYDGGHTDPLRGATALGFSAHGTIDRSQWGVTQWSAATGNEVQIVIEAEFVKTSAPAN